MMPKLASRRGPQVYASAKALKSSFTALTLFSLALITLAQTLSPGEVRIRSWPYQSSPPALRVRTNEVQLGVVVRDGKGHVLRGLTQKDFAVYDDGKEQSLSSFSVEHRLVRRPAVPAAVTAPANRSSPSQTPAQQRYVALYFDDLHTKPGDMRHVQLAAENFIHTGLAANDQIALFTASSAVNVDFTPDASKVLAALAKLQSHARTFDSGSCPRITGYDAYLIVNHLDPNAYNTAVAAAQQCNCDNQLLVGDRNCYAQQERVVMMQAQQTWEPMREISENTLGTIEGVENYLASKPGERVMVLASSGFLTGTLDQQIDSVVSEALHTGIVINALDAKGLYTEDPSHGKALDELQPNSQAGSLEFSHEQENFLSSLTSVTAGMADFAVGTGGRFFHNRNDLAAGYYSLAAAPETEYLLGFVPEKEKFNGEFHKLKVALGAPGKFYVQARPGYFAPSKEAQGQANQPTPEELIDAEVRASDERNDFPLAVSERLVAAKGGSELSIQTHVDIQNLPFKKENGRRVDMLTFVAALFDADGKMVAGKEAQMQFALKPDTFERFSKSGINGNLFLSAPPGTYRLRVVVEEALRDEITASTHPVRIP